MKPIEDSELILNKDGSIFHLHLLPDDIADTIILVGDQSRVEVVSAFFDKIEVNKQNREFKTHTGYFNGMRLSVVSTGIGTDNIDIVLNELDAITNIDLKTRTEKPLKKCLNFVRIGTSGALQADIPVDTPIVTKTSIGFDGMLNFYAGRNEIADLESEAEFLAFTRWNPLLAKPYFVEASETLFQKIGSNYRSGFTISAPGFYGPQGRKLRLDLADADLNRKISEFSYRSMKINNYEMESSAIYGLSKLMGHEALTICSIIANRMRKEYSKDYRTGVKNLIEDVLNRLTD